MIADPPLIQTDSISFERDGGLILDRVDWTVQRGEHWVMLGPNGAGKSTLAGLVTGSEWPTTGRVRLFGFAYGQVDLRTLRRRIGYFQPAQYRETGLFHPKLTALEVVCTGTDAAVAVYHEYDETILDAARTLLRSTFPSLPHPEDREFRFLSSGERQRVLLARAIVNRPELLVLDEPFESLDIAARFALENVLARLLIPSTTGSMKATTITILQKIEEIPPFVTHALLIKGGRILDAGPVADVLESGRISLLYQMRLRVEKNRDRYTCFPE